jgi:hypothetical protein
MALGALTVGTLFGQAMEIVMGALLIFLGERRRLSPNPSSSDPAPAADDRRGSLTRVGEASKSCMSMLMVGLSFSSAKNFFAALVGGGVFGWLHEHTEKESQRD